MVVVEAGSIEVVVVVVVDGGTTVDVVVGGTAVVVGVVVVVADGTVTVVVVVGGIGAGATNVHMADAQSPGVAAWTISTPGRLEYDQTRNPT